MPYLRSPQREKYAQNVARGMTLSDAYRDAFPRSKKWTKNTLYVHASQLKNDPLVAARIDEIRSEYLASAVMDRNERLIALSEIARDKEAWPKQRMQAIDLLNKMDAVYVHKVDAQVHGDIGSAAEQVEAILNE